MQKVDATLVLKTLDNTPIILDPNSNEPAVLGKVLAWILQGYKGVSFGNDIIKTVELAKAFYKQEFVEIDKADIAKLEKVIKEDKMFSPLALAQILEVLRDAPDVPEKPVAIVK